MSRWRDRFLNRKVINQVTPDNNINYVNDYGDKVSISPEHKELFLSLKKYSDALNAASDELPPYIKELIQPALNEYGHKILELVNKTAGTDLRFKNALKKILSDAYHSPSDQDGIAYDHMSSGQHPEMIRSGMECTACGYKMADMIKESNDTPSGTGSDYGGAGAPTSQVMGNGMEVNANCPKCGGPMRKFGGDGEMYPKTQSGNGSDVTDTTSDNSLIKNYMSDGSQKQAKFSFKFSRATEQ